MKAARSARITSGQAQFLAWFKHTHPSLYAQAAQSAGLGDVGGIADGFNSLLNSATGLLSQYVAGKSQLDTLKINLARAKAGQAPIAAGALPVERAAPSGLAAVPGWVWIAGAGGLLFLLLKKG